MNSVVGLGVIVCLGVVCVCERVHTWCMCVCVRVFVRYD